MNTTVHQSRTNNNPSKCDKAKPKSTG